MKYFSELSPEAQVDFMLKLAEDLAPDPSRFAGDYVGTVAHSIADRLETEADAHNDPIMWKGVSNIHYSAIVDAVTNRILAFRNQE